MLKRIRGLMPTKRVFAILQRYRGAILLCLPLLIYLGYFEARTPAGFAVILGYTLAIASLIMLWSKKLYSSIIIVTIFTFAVAALSAVKVKFMSLALHSFDAYFYLFSISNLQFLFATYPRIIFPALTVGALLILAGVFAFRRDQSQVRPATAGKGLLAGVALIAAFHSSGRPMLWDYFNGLYPVSVFYDSFQESFSMAMRGGKMLEAAAHTHARPFEIQQSCRLTSKPPHIILIHQESNVPFSAFRQQTYDKSVDPLFRSQDGQLHGLSVETHGGGSWMTEFSILTGLSSEAFGSMKAFVQVMMRDRVKEALPSVLSRCGYKSAVFYPFAKSFVGNGPFYQAIGFDKIFDRKDQKSTRFQERDRFYYDNALKYLDDEIANNKGPAFIYLLNAAMHGPYTSVLFPEVKVPDGPPQSSSETAEYLRRQQITKMDVDYFIAELGKRFPDESFVIVQYGDHHPSFTTSFPEYAEYFEKYGSEILPPQAYQTYYRVDTMKHPWTPLPRFPFVHSAYLGALILQQAGLPLPPAYEERLRMMNLCWGTYHLCVPREIMLDFHRRLIDAGIVETSN